MDWHFCVLLALAALMPFVQCWSAIPSTKSIRGRQRNAVSPYLDLVLCPLREQPWTCARQQSGRILDGWDSELHSQWQKLKVEADIQLNSTIEKRGYSASEIVTKEKPSTILKKIEIGTNYMKEYLAETMDGFLGREYNYGQNFKNHHETQNEEPNSNDEQADEPDNDVDDDEAEEDGDAEEDGEAEEDEDEETDSEDHAGDVKNTNVANEGTFNDNEFIDIEDHGEETIGQLKKPGDRNKRRKKKKGDQHEVATQAANLLVIQPLEHQLAQQHHDQELTHKVKPTRTKVKPLRQKRRKRKKKGQALDDDSATIVVEQQPSSDHLSLGLLEALSEVDILDDGGKRKKQRMKYGRSNGVTRGKKKKKKKALQKLILLGSFLKAKIELLLKVLGAHLQIKFFAIALIGLLINIARFWIDVKRGGAPQKVVYVEHAHHQHHYEDHGEDWNESGGGGYWKRSLQTDTPADDYDSATDSYQPRPQAQQQQQQSYDGQYMAYRNQWQRK